MVIYAICIFKQHHHFFHSYHRRQVWRCLPFHRDTSDIQLSPPRSGSKPVSSGKSSQRVGRSAAVLSLFFFPYIFMHGTTLPAQEHSNQAHRNACSFEGGEYPHSADAVRFTLKGKTVPRTADTFTSDSPYLFSHSSIYVMPKRYLRPNGRLLPQARFQQT